MNNTFEKYFKKNVAIIDIDNEKFRGKVISCVGSYDNENGKESMILEEIKTGNLIEFYDDEINTITALE